jgi:hypothetical protein
MRLPDSKPVEPLTNDLEAKRKCGGCETAKEERSAREAVKDS